MKTPSFESQRAWKSKRNLPTLLWILSGLMVLAAGLTPRSAPAAAPTGSYPNKTIRFIVPFGAGGAGDMTARHVAKALEPILGQTIVVDNKPGANGIIGTDLAARANADGYTWMLGSIGTHVTNQYLYSKLAYDPLNDFIPVALLMTIENVVTVSSSSSIKTLADLIQQAKARPGQLNYGIPAIGDSAHLSVEKFWRDAGIQVTGVPYKSVPAATIDVIGGRIDFMFSAISGQAGQISSGAVRALATTGPTRSAALPDVPTVAESGFPGFSGVVWLGLFVPAKTSPAIVAKLAADVQKAYDSPEVRRTMMASGIQAVTSTPKEFADFIATERVKWLKVIKDANIKLD